MVQIHGTPIYGVEFMFSKSLKNQQDKKHQASVAFRFGIVKSAIESKDLFSLVASVSPIAFRFEIV